jgi:hypothetical protein
MDNLENEFTQTHSQEIRHGITDRQIRISGPRFIDRGLTLLGDTLIRMGTRLKEHTYGRLTAEDDSVHNFLIML